VEIIHPIAVTDIEIPDRMVLLATLPQPLVFTIVDW